MTTEQRKKLDEAKRLLAEVEQDMGKSVEATMVEVCKQYGKHPHALMFASMELGQVMAAKKALEEL